MSAQILVPSNTFLKKLDGLLDEINNCPRFLIELCLIMCCCIKKEREVNQQVTFSFPFLHFSCFVLLERHRQRHSCFNSQSNILQPFIRMVAHREIRPLQPFKLPAADKHLDDSDELLQPKCGLCTTDGAWSAPLWQIRFPQRIE